MALSRRRAREGQPRVAAGGVAEAFAVSALAAGPVEIEVDSAGWAASRRSRRAPTSSCSTTSTLDDLRERVAVRDESRAPAVVLEASGGLTLEVGRAVGETGVDYIAVGELTHSAPVLDLGLDLTAVV